MLLNGKFSRQFQLRKRFAGFINLYSISPFIYNTCSLRLMEENRLLQRIFVFLFSVFWAIQKDRGCLLETSRGIAICMERAMHMYMYMQQAARENRGCTFTSR